MADKKPLGYLADSVTICGVTLPAGTAVYETGPEVDPYAELKAAFAAGKAIQGGIGNGRWGDCFRPEWLCPPDCYRVKPEEPATPAAEPQATPAPDAINTLAEACAKDDDGPVHPCPVTAASVLERAAGHMQARASTYDEPRGERSMGKAVNAFNAITGRDLDESEGWLLLQLLKDVRLFTAPGYHADSAEDAAAYTALMAEAKAREADQDAKLISLLAGGAQ